MSLNDVIGLPQFEAEHILKEGNEVFIHGKLQNTGKTCPSCGSEALKPHQYYQKKVRHLPFGNLPTYLVFERKDWICGCGKVFLERLDFQELYAHNTVQYADYVYELAKKQDLKRVAELENLSWELAGSLFLKVGKKRQEALKAKGFNGKTEFHADEIAFKKGHSDFETIIYTKDGIVGKKSLDLQELLKTIPGLGQIQRVCIDMCAAFADAIRQVLPQAEIVIDRFHIIKLLNRKLDKLRVKTAKKLEAPLQKEFSTIRFSLFKDECALNKEKKPLWKNIRGSIRR